MLNGPVYEYGAIPPVAESDTVVVPPFTAMVPGVTVRLSGDGWPTTATAVAVTLLASRTVTTYDPAANPVAVAPVCTGVVFQLYVYGAVPPDTLTVASPLDSPKHPAFFTLLILTESGGTITGAGSVMVIVFVSVHPRLSRTVYV